METERTPEHLIKLLRSMNGRAVGHLPITSGHTEDICRDAANAIERLQEELRKRDGGEVSRVLVSGTIGFNGAKAITVERLQEVFMAFAKFDGNDWDFLLGLRRYSPHGVTLAYRGDGRGGRERQMQEALTILRAAVEETKPEEPSEAAKAFVSQWGSGTADYRHQMAIAFDKAVGR